MEKKRHIELNDTEMRKKICDFFGVSSPMLTYALRYQRNGKKARAMRAMALENGGVLFEEVEKVKSKNVDV